MGCRPSTARGRISASTTRGLRGPRSWLHLSLISDFDLQALLDQPQHTSVHGTPLDHNQQVVTRNGRKVAAKINFRHAPNSRIARMEPSIS